MHIIYSVNTPYIEGRLSLAIMEEIGAQSTNNSILSRPIVLYCAVNSHIRSCRPPAAFSPSASRAFLSCIFPLNGPVKKHLPPTTQADFSQLDFNAMQTRLSLTLPIITTRTGMPQLSSRLIIANTT